MKNKTPSQGQLLEEAIEEEGISYRELSKAIDVDESTLYRWRKDISQITSDKMAPLCVSLNKPPEYFVVKKLIKRKKPIIFEPIFTQSEQNLVNTYRCLAPGVKNAIKTIVNYCKK